MIAKQPNGKYCRVSTIVDAPTHWNWSEKDLERYLIKTNQFQPNNIDKWIKSYAISFTDIQQYINTNNITEEKIKEWLIEVEE